MKYIIYILFGLLLGCNTDNNSTDSQTEKTSKQSTKKSNTQNETAKVDAANDTLAFNFDTTLTFVLRTILEVDKLITKLIENKS